MDVWWWSFECSHFLLLNQWNGVLRQKRAGYVYVDILRLVIHSSGGKGPHSISMMSLHDWSTRGRLDAQMIFIAIIITLPRSAHTRLVSTQGNTRDGEWRKETDLRLNGQTLQKLPEKNIIIPFNGMWKLKRRQKGSLTFWESKPHQLHSGGGGRSVFYFLHISDNPGLLDLTNFSFSIHTILPLLLCILHQ